MTPTPKNSINPIQLQKIRTRPNYLSSIKTKTPKLKIKLGQETVSGHRLKKERF